MGLGLGFGDGREGEGEKRRVGEGPESSCEDNAQTGILSHAFEDQKFQSSALR
jgi:hypothetical protein